MNAVTSIPTLINSSAPNIPLSRFEALSVTASTLGQLLHPLDHRHGRDCLQALVSIQSRLQHEHLAAERALLAVADAKAEVRRVDEMGSMLIDGAVTVGRILKFEDIIAFEKQDEAWFFSVEGLITAFRGHGELGRQFADRYAEVLQEGRTANAELQRAMAEHARATAAFSVEYRDLASTITVARAILGQLGVEVPRLGPKKKAKVADSVPVTAPAPMPEPESP